MVSYALARSRRKTVAIYINKDATVEVRAPLKTPQKDIDQFVASKEKWIRSHINRRLMINSEKAAFSLQYSDMVILCGRAYPICARDGKQAGFDGECLFLPAGLPPDGIKHAVVQIYRKTAKYIIMARVAVYAEHMRVEPAGIRITGAKTRWGSCSGNNGVSFSWRLVMGDQSVIDYVVVHELAHIKEHNHSPRFWAVVEGVLPDYKQRRLELKTLQDRLSCENWD